MFMSIMQEMCETVYDEELSEKIIVQPVHISVFSMLLAHTICFGNKSPKTICRYGISYVSDIIIKKKKLR